MLKEIASEFRGSHQRKPLSRSGIRSSRRDPVCDGPPGLIRFEIVRAELRLASLLDRRWLNAQKPIVVAKSDAIRRQLVAGPHSRWSIQSACHAIGYDVPVPSLDRNHLFTLRHGAGVRLKRRVCWWVHFDFLAAKTAFHRQVARLHPDRPEGNAEALILATDAWNWLRKQWTKKEALVDRMASED